LYCSLPPDYDKEKYGTIIQYDESLGTPETKTQEISTNKEESKENELELDKNGEIVEGTKHPLRDDEFFEDQPVEEDGYDPYEGLDNDDLLMLLLEGKVVKGIKLTKEQRRDMKFALKRGEVRIILIIIC